MDDMVLCKKAHRTRLARLHTELYSDFFHAVLRAGQVPMLPMLNINGEGCCLHNIEQIQNLSLE